VKGNWRRCVALLLLLVAEVQVAHLHTKKAAVVEEEEEEAMAEPADVEVVV